MAVQWLRIKIKENPFDANKIDFLASQKNGHKFVTIWAKILSIAIKKNGDNQFSIRKEIPYTDAIMTEYFEERRVLIKTALKMFEAADLVEILDDPRRTEAWLQYKNVRDYDSEDRLATIEAEKALPRRQYGTYQNVLLTDPEFTKLKVKYPNMFERKIEDMSSYIHSTGKRYKNHYSTLERWIKKDQEYEQNREEAKKNASNLEEFYDLATAWQARKNENK